MSDQLDLIIRCDHDKENPYVMVNRDLVRDPNMSPQCRWFIIFCLSFDKTWHISIPHFIKSQGISKDKMYSMINEAIEHGYVKRESINNKGLKRYRYIISESAKFKKSLPCPENPDTEKPDTVFQDTKNKQSSSYEEEKKEQCKERSTTSPVSGEAVELGEYFFQKIKEKKEDFKGKAVDKWPQVFDLMIRLDNRSPKHIKEVIDYLVDDVRQLAYCLSAKRLREKFDELQLKLLSKGKQSLINSNRDYARKLKERFPDQMRSMSFDDKYVRNVSMAKDVSFDLPFDTFKRALVSMFGGEHVQ